MIRAISEQFQSNFRAISEQFQSNFIRPFHKAIYLEEAGGLGGWKESVFLEELHDQLPALIQDPAEGRKILL